jgi:hypothetical protein
VNTLPKKFSEKVDFSGDCWLWIACKCHGGYGQYFSRPKQVSAHRFSWMHFNGDIPIGLKVLHKCDVRACVNPEHLFLGSSKDNSVDMVKKGRSARGERQGLSKLSSQDVADIRNQYSRGRSKSEFSLYGLAKRYGVSHAQISNIVNFKQRVMEG